MTIGVVTIVFVSSLTGKAQDNSVTSYLKMKDLFHAAVMSDTIPIDNAFIKLDSLLKEEPFESTDYIVSYLNRYEYEKSINSYFERTDYWLRLLEQKFLKDSNRKDVLRILEKRTHYLSLLSKRNEKTLKHINAISKEMETLKKSLK